MHQVAQPKKIDIHHLVKCLYAPKTVYTGPLREIIKRKEESTPALLNLLKEVLDDYKQVPGERCDFVIALYILAYFREPLAFPSVIQFAELPGNWCYDLLADHLTESLARWIVSTYNGNLQAIKKVIENEELDPYARNAALQSLLGLFAQKILSREEIIEYFRKLYSSELIQNSDFATFLVTATTYMHPEEFYSEICSLYEAHTIDEFSISKEFVDEALKADKEQYIEQSTYYERFPPPITEVRKEVFMVNSKDTSRTKIGRNDPCYCGSTKKYKMCCLPSLNF